MRPLLLALTLLVVLPGCGYTAAVRNAREGVRNSYGPGPSVVWSGSVQRYTDAEYQTPVPNYGALPFRFEVYQGGPRDGADGVARFGNNASCVYRLTRAGVVAENDVTIINFDATYAGGSDLSSTGGRMAADLSCGHASAHGRFITAPTTDGLIVGFVGESSDGRFAYYRGVLATGN